MGYVSNMFYATDDREPEAAGGQHPNDILIPEHLICLTPRPRSAQTASLARKGEQASSIFAVGAAQR
jgi:hypothetical protein